MPVISKNVFFGRERELKQLQRLRSTVKDKVISRFSVVSGRHRIGKTRLILEALPFVKKQQIYRTPFDICSL